VKGDVPLVKDKEGNIFIDRDGTSFEYILDFLRNGEMIYPSDIDLRSRIKTNLAYFNLKSIKKV